MCLGVDEAGEPFPGVEKDDKIREGLNGTAIKTNLGRRIEVKPPLTVSVCFLMLSVGETGTVRSSE